VGLVDETSVLFSGQLDIWLDIDERCLRGVEMKPLLTGELELLACLGSRPNTWHCIRVLSQRVYQRKDPGASQLVWKYASTLRQKISVGLPDMLQACRRRGYLCRAAIHLVSAHAAVALQDVLSDDGCEPSSMPSRTCPRGT
jgi:DNA-binding response OmpR family regulator